MCVGVAGGIHPVPEMQGVQVRHLPGEQRVMTGPDHLNYVFFPSDDCVVDHLSSIQIYSTLCSLTCSESECQASAVRIAWSFEIISMQSGMVFGSRMIHAHLS